MVKNKMVKKAIFKKMLVCIMSLTLVSCTAYKKIPYLKDAETLSNEQLIASSAVYSAKFMPNDILSITVNSETPGIVNDFNSPILSATTNQITQTNVSTSSLGSGTLQNYIVDNKGNIEFPVLGAVSVAGLTRMQLQEKIANLIYPYYTSKKPIVNVRFLNYKVAVLGEVAKPGIYTSENNVMTLFDALASAGDLTIYGKRDNVMLLRENEKGELNVHRINLQDKNILLQKDIYYLQQNDKIIVEPNKTKGNNSSIGTVESLTLSGALSAISILISIIAITK